MHLQIIHGDCLGTGVRNLMYGSRHAKTCLRACADSEGPDQTAHSRSLIWAFPVHKPNHWILQNLWMESKCLDDTLRMRGVIWICAHFQMHVFAWHGQYIFVPIFIPQGIRCLSFMYNVHDTKEIKNNILIISSLYFLKTICASLNYRNIPIIDTV